ncbi:MAG: hypothetical protein G01um101448_79 [Parcubacteria group bacterium Gr01-1014_48]|nr:MAG: hypothetical protein G01um101448_79 [Parcubacteria group bacterium Gr01-1014_48]
MDIYIDKKFLNKLKALAAYVDFGFASLKAIKRGNPLTYSNDLILADSPTKVSGQDLTHEMFHAIFDLHDDELSSAQIPDDEALTAYFDFVVQIGFQRLIPVEKELEKARNGKKCNQRIFNKSLDGFESELTNFLITGNGNKFLPILPQALELMKQLTGFNVPITEIVNRYRNGECGVCIAK